MIRYEDDATVSTVATWAAVGEHPPVPDRWPTEPGDPATMIAETRQPARVEDWAAVPGPIAAVIREELGVSSSVGCPIMVEGRLWGALAIHSKQPVALPPDIEERIGRFGDLVATAIANAEARAEIERLADQQAALRRVATLIAAEAPAAQVFAKVVEELANVLTDVDCSLWRDEHDGTATMVAVWGERLSPQIQVGNRMPVDGNGVIASVLREGRPYRRPGYSTAAAAIAEDGRGLGIRSAVGCPIVVGGEIWGAIGAARYAEGALPPEAETHIAQFADLVATAVANAEARAEVERLADEQAALRRVATLVAQGASPAVVLDAVAAEMERLLDADAVAVGRYESDHEVTVVAQRSPEPGLLPIGERLNYEGHNISTMIRSTERPARIEDLSRARGGFAEFFRRLGFKALVGTPIIVEGRVWGAVVAGWSREEPPPADTEERMARFAELLETAIANADSRDQLTASRARLLTAGDDARRRVVRDLHDGAQQRLVHTIVTLKLAQRAFAGGDGKAESLVGEALKQAERSNAELRELAQGILPSVLTRGGLRAGVDTLVQRIDLPVDVDIPRDRFPAEAEASAYFVIAEALTNVMKHSHAKSAKVSTRVRDGTLYVEVRDDGIGGADPDGHGLIGVSDRVTALGGRLKVETLPGAGTLVSATLPLSSR
jgi:signal transduction histidine kinase